MSCAHTRAATDMNCTHISGRGSMFCTWRHPSSFGQTWMCPRRGSQTALEWVPTAQRGCQILRCVTCFTIRMNLHDFPSEHVITAASVLTMPDTGRLPRILWKCCLCCIWTPVENVRLPPCHRLMKSHNRGKCGMCAYQWMTTMLVECHATRRGTALVERHVYPRSAMSCSIVLTAGALASGSSHIFVRG